MHIQHAQHGMEVVVVRDALVHAGAGAAFVHAGARLQAARPQQPGHMLLRVRGNRIGQAMQVQAVFAQRFTMVGHIHQRRLVLTLLFLQPVDGAGHKQIGLAHAVVIHIHQLGMAAVGRDMRGAFGLELLGGSAGAAVVGRAVAAHLVQHQHSTLGTCGFRQGLQALVQQAHHQLVQALAVLAPLLDLGRCGDLVGLGMRNAVAHAFAARLVVQPVHTQPCGLQHIQQIAVFKLATFVARLAQVREHARHRRQRVGAAGPGLAPVDDLARCQLRCGVARVAIQAKVVRTRGFPHHQHQQRRFVGARGSSGVRAAQGCAFGDAAERPIGLEQRLECDLGE